MATKNILGKYVLFPVVVFVALLMITNVAISGEYDSSADRLLPDQFDHPLDRPDAWIEWAFAPMEVVADQPRSSHLGVAIKQQHGTQWQTRVALSEVFDGLDHSYGAVTSDITWQHTITTWNATKTDPARVTSSWDSTLFLRATFELALPLSASSSYQGHTSATMGWAIDGVLHGVEISEPHRNNVGLALWSTVGKTTNGPWWILVAGRIQAPFGISFSCGWEWSAFGDNHNVATLRARSMWLGTTILIVREENWGLDLRSSLTTPASKWLWHEGTNLNRPGIRMESAVYLVVTVRLR